MRDRILILSQGWRMAGSKPGPKPKRINGGQTTLRAERAHLEYYRRKAQQQGKSLTEYLADVLAAAHGLTDKPRPEQLQLPSSSADDTATAVGA